MASYGKDVQNVASLIFFGSAISSGIICFGIGIAIGIYIAKYT